MNPSIDFVSVQVRDLAASRRFYTEVLGFTPDGTERPEAVVFRTDTGALFAIRKPLMDLGAVPQLGAGVGLWFAVTDVDALHTRVVSGGGRVVRPPAEGPFGRMMVAADPDGYPLTFHQAPRGAA